jgi:hypothetical protein
MMAPHASTGSLVELRRVLEEQIAARVGVLPEERLLPSMRRLMQLLEGRRSAQGWLAEAAAAAVCAAAKAVSTFLSL